MWWQLLQGTLLTSFKTKGNSASITLTVFTNSLTFNCIHRYPHTHNNHTGKFIGKFIRIPSSYIYSNPVHFMFIHVISIVEPMNIWQRGKEFLKAFYKQSSVSNVCASWLCSDIYFRLESSILTIRKTLFLWSSFLTCLVELINP